MKYIGLSLSNCVADILADKVSINDVAFIISGTRITDEESLYSVMDTYGETYWKNCSYS